VGGRTIATLCSQFHKLRSKTPRGKASVALTDGSVFELLVVRCFIKAALEYS